MTKKPDMSNSQICDRTAHMGVNWDGRIVVFGGQKKSEKDDTKLQFISYQTIWTYKLGNDCWIPYTIPDDQVVPPVVNGACVEVIGGDIYMFGGKVYRGEKHITNALWKLHKTKANGLAWTQVTFANKASQPSPRKDHCSWEYDDKLWIYGGSGPPIHEYMHKHSRERFEVLDDTGEGINFQVLCFDPSNGKWNIPDIRGAAKPQPLCCASRIRDKVWACNMFDPSMHVLDMRLLTWFKIRVSGQVIPRVSISFQTFSAVTDTQIVLHGGLEVLPPQSDILEVEPLRDTWIFNVETAVWTPYAGAPDHARHSHTAVKGNNNSVMCLGGIKAPFVIDGIRKIQVSDDVYWIKLEPDSLLKLALTAVFKHRDVSEHLWKEHLPATLYADLIQMCKIKP